MELALTGDFITAQRAYELGFVNRLPKAPRSKAAQGTGPQRLPPTARWR
jgi:enoyl-CoA hydratase